MYWTEQGEYACPVCGSTSPADPPWDESGASFDICTFCHTQFGYDDGMSPDSPIGAFQKMWDELRLKWLEKENWPDWALAQLRNIEVDGEALKENRTRKNDQGDERG